MFCHEAADEWVLHCLDSKLGEKRKEEKGGRKERGREGSIA